jgi:hypothetical protein
VRGPAPAGQRVRPAALARYRLSSSIDHQLPVLVARPSASMVSTTLMYRAVCAGNVTVSGSPVPVQLATVVQVCPLRDTSRS